MVAFRWKYQTVAAAVMVVTNQKSRHSFQTLIQESEDGKSHDDVLLLRVSAVEAKEHQIGSLFQVNSLSSGGGGLALPCPDFNTLLMSVTRSINPDKFGFVVWYSDKHEGKMVIGAIFGVLNPVSGQSSSVSASRFLLFFQLSKNSFIFGALTRADNKATLPALFVALPVLSPKKKWVMLYSTWRHDMSLPILYRKVDGAPKGEVFGGLVRHP
ncbi:hypothetical protein M8C21_028725 [Ambrosia artemisiifolia]|uniref:Uncharacterized protein n=1 Tax=Ambrosia artemisiifolia TaxID=4212 RepID=A0AAD5G692_AMBAR|nr:hypothetical protein M8C21_028725 [Ambrosia artemisiifolia]